MIVRGGLVLGRKNTFCVLEEDVNEENLDLGDM